MPVIDIIESWQKDGGWSHSGEPSSGTTTATRKFTVTFTIGTLVPEILANPGLPQKGQAHPWNALFKCRGCKVKLTGPTSAEATANYDMARAIGENEQPNEEVSPLDEPAQIRVSTQKMEGPLEEDVNGMPITNTVNETSVGVTRLFSDTVLSITKNLSVSQFALTNVSAFCDHVNSAPFLAFPAGRLRLDTVEAEQVNDDEGAYWSVTANIMDRLPVVTTDERAWYFRTINKGFQRNYGTAQNPEIKNHLVDGETTPEPIWLDQDGFIVTDPEQVYFLEFEIYPTTDFNAFGIYP